MKFIWYTEVGVVGGLNEEIGGIYEMWEFLTSLWTCHLHCVPRLRMHDCIPPVPHMIRHIPPYDFVGTPLLLQY